MQCCVLTVGGGTVCAAGGSSSSSSSSQPFALLRFLRLLRLAKLVRLLRASRLYNRWIKRVTLSTGTLTLIQCFVGVSLTTHWWACIIGLQTMLHADVPQTWLGPHAYNYCPTLSAAAVNASSSSVDAYFTSCPSLDPATFYLASLTWAMLLISGTGGTDYYPSSTSNGETMVVGALTILGALLWTYVLALFVEHVTNANPGLTQFHQLLDGLNDYISYHRLPDRMGERMREYLHQQKGVQLHLFDERALHSLSKTMQIEVTLHVHRSRPPIELTPAYARAVLRCSRPIFDPPLEQALALLGGVSARPRAATACASRTVDATGDDGAR
jgi:hypothetical protein